MCLAKCIRIYYMYKSFEADWRWMVSLGTLHVHLRMRNHKRTCACSCRRRHACVEICGFARCVGQLPDNRRGLLCRRRGGPLECVVA